ncbi:MAG: hypothetical protein ACYTXY_06815, partial [Nostoc sp.]
MPSTDMIIPTDASSSQGGLLPSSLTGTSFSSGSENNSSLIGLQKTSSTSSATGLIDSNQGSLTNYSNSVSTISESLPLFNQSLVSTSISSQSLPNNPTTDFDPLTGSSKNLSRSSIPSNDSLLNSSSVLKGKFGNFDNSKNFQLTLQDAKGNPESFSLTGDGEGEVFQTDLGEQIIFTGTDGTTKVQISASNNLKFGDYIGSELKVQTKGSITSGNITLKNTALDNSAGLSLQSGLSDEKSSTDSGYSVIDLSTLLGGNATAINDSGQIVGRTTNNDTFLYSDGKMTDLGTLPGGSDSYPEAINNSGQIAGIYRNNDSAYNGFLYSDGKMTDLGTLPGGSDSYLGAINNSGQIVGTSSTSMYDKETSYDLVTAYFENQERTVYRPESHAFLYQNGNMSDLGTLPGDTDSNATSINNSGQIVGDSQKQVFHDTSVYVSGGGYGTEPGHISHNGYYTTEGQAFIYSNGNMTGLGTLPGGNFSTARDINNSGQVIGDSNTGNNSQHAFLYSQGQMTDLGTLTGYQYSSAIAINDAGQIIGGDSGGNGKSDHPFLYSNGKMTDLNSLIPQDSGWTLSDARAINNKGQIIGDGHIGGQYHQFLLNPISTTATPKDGITVGNISTQGSSVFLQGLKINLTGSNVVTKGGNITLDGPTILNSSTGAYTFNSAKSTAISNGGDITFKNTLDSNSVGASSLSLTGGLGNITFNNAVGGNASLKDLTVNSAKTFTANGDITSKGNITAITTQDITTKNLTSNSGAVSLISTEGAVITTGDITSTSGGVAILATQKITTNNINSQNGTVTLSSHAGAVTTTGDINTNGGSVDIAAGGDVVIHTILSHGGGVNLISSLGAVKTSGDIIASNDVNIEAGGNVATSNILSHGGAVNLSSTTGSITARGDIATSSGFVDIEASGDVATHSITSKNGAVSLISNQGIITATGDITTEGGYVNIEATENVATSNILSHGGGIYLSSTKGSVNTGFLNSDGNGTGGDVDVQAAGVFQATGSVAINGKNYSIYAGNGSDQSGKINIIAQGSASLLSESLSPNYSKDLGKSQGTQPNTSSIQLANDPTFHLEIHQDQNLQDQNLWPAQINLSANKQQQLQGFIKQLWDAGKPLGEFVLGTMYQFLYDNGGTVRELLKPLQLTPKEEALWERTLPSSTAFKLGRTLGGGAAIVQGIAEFLTGSLGEAGGGGLCLTGIACPGGVAVIAAGAILQSHGAATAIFSAGEEGKLLRDLLSPNRMESSMGGSEELAKELGVSSGQIEQALSVIPAGEIRQLHGELGQDLFEQLLKKDQKAIHDFSRALDLAGNDTAAGKAIAETLRLNKKG